MTRIFPQPEPIGREARSARIRCRVSASGFRTPIRHAIRAAQGSPLASAIHRLSDADHVHTHWCVIGSDGLVHATVDSRGVRMLREAAAQVAASRVAALSRAKAAREDFLMGRAA